MSNQTPSPLPKWITFTNGAVRTSTVESIEVRRYWWFEGGGCAVAVNQIGTRHFLIPTPTCAEAENLLKKLIASFKLCE